MVTSPAPNRLTPFTFLVQASTPDTDAAVIAGLNEEHGRCQAHGPDGTSAVSAPTPLRAALSNPDLASVFTMPLHPPSRQDITPAIGNAAPLDATTQGWAVEIPSPQAIALLPDRVTLAGGLLPPSKAHTCQRAPEPPTGRHTDHADATRLAPTS